MQHVRWTSYVCVIFSEQTERSFFALRGAGALDDVVASALNYKAYFSNVRMILTLRVRSALNLSFVHLQLS